MIIYFAGNSSKARINYLIENHANKMFSFLDIIDLDRAFGESDRFDDYIRAFKGKVKDVLSSACS